MLVADRNTSKPLICHIQITEIHMMPRVWREAVSAKNNGFNVIVMGEGVDCDYEGIKFIGFHKEDNRLKRMLIRSRKMIRHAISLEPDIIEVHSPEFLLYYRMIKAKGIKLIFNSHEFYAYQIKLKQYIPKKLRAVASCLYSHIESYICKRIDCVFYPCTVDGKNLFEGRAKRSVKIENFSMPEVVERQETIPNSIIYAGSLTEKRGITTLVEIANKLDCALYLCGRFGSEDYERYIKRIADKEKVRFLGTISRRELMSLYGKMQIGISLLKKDGQYDHIDNLSTKIYEYMQCGLPAIITDFDYAKKIVEDYPFAITVNPDDKEQVSEAVVRLLDDEILCDKMSRAGVMAYNERFNWTQEEGGLIAEYERLCS